MQLQLNGKRVTLLGDPHLGRSFIHGVPLSRRGEREKLVWKDFQHSLEAEVDLHICIGDLFDKAIVPYDIIVEAARAYEAAARANPDTHYVILKGNHDWLRDLERVSAFDVFTRMVRDVANITVVTTTMVMHDMAFFAWHPTITAKKMVENIGSLGEKLTHAFGHWDIESFGGSDDNLIPTAPLAAIGITKAFTGHIHKPQQFVRDGVDVDVVGSMQPYAHGEEGDDSIYLTLNLQELAKIDKATLRNKCVRVVLQSGEILDDEIECLQLTIKKVTEDDDAIPDVSLGDFDMESLFLKAFSDAGVSEKTTASLLEKFSSGRLTGDA